MPAQPTAPLDRPLAFAHYDLIRRLGRGGMGEVWSVVRRGPRDMARSLALKVLLPELSRDPQYEKTFETEGKISMQLSSSNIVPVFQTGRHNGLLYMEMERVDGVNLATFQRRSRNVHSLLPLDVVVYIIGEVFAALFVAHEHVVVGRPAGVLHRDVKPGNILISSTGDVRLIDFGIARPLTGAPTTQLPIGTWRYMAPEQAAGRAERGSDLFSVGVIFHELLTGEPFRPGGMTTMQYYRTAIEYDVIPELGRVIPPELERLRRGLLEPDVSKRFQSAAEAMQCLSEWPGHRFSKLLLARIYETAIGTRSSGFTDAHEIMPPSFLFHQHEEPQGADEPDEEDNTVFFCRPDLSVAPDTDEVDEDAKTMLRRPWLGRAQWMSKLRVPPERQQPDRMKAPPVIARVHDKSVGPHPVAVAPPPEPANPTPTSRVSTGDVTEARAVTPTLRLVMSMGQAESSGQPRDPSENTDPLSFGPERDAPRQSASASGSIEPSKSTTSGGVVGAEVSAPESGSRPSPSADSSRRSEERLRPWLVVALLASLATLSASWAIHSCATSVEDAP